MLDLKEAAITARDWMDRWSKRNWDAIPFREVQPSDLVNFYLEAFCCQILGPREDLDE